MCKGLKRYNMGTKSINQLSVQQSAEEWRNVLKEVYDQNKGEAEGHSYIVLNGTHYEALPSSKFTPTTLKESVADIVKTSQEKFTDLKESLNKQLGEKGCLTDKEVKEFKSVGSDIASYTEAMIKARESKRELSKVYRGIAAVLCCMTAIFGVGLYFGYQMWQENKKFKQGISDLRKNVIAMRHDIQTMGKDQKIVEMAKKLDIPYQEAEKYLQLMQPFVKEEMSHLNSEEYANLVGMIVEQTINGELSAYYRVDPEERPAMLEQFSKDMTRHVTFKRIDSSHPKKINDLLPLPPRTEATNELDQALQAISDLVVHEKDKEWGPALQLLMTQTTLNAAFLRPRLNLLQIGSQIQWEQSGKDYALLPEFPESGFPPTHLEMIRDEDGAIKQVNVSVDGSLDMNKVQQNVSSTDKEAFAPVIPGAVQIKLNYTVTLGSDKMPIFSAFKIVCATNIPVIEAKKG